MRICISKSKSDKLSGFRVAGLALGLTTEFIRGMFMNKLDILRKVSYSAKQIFLIPFSVPKYFNKPTRICFEHEKFAQNCLGSTGGSTQLYPFLSNNDTSTV